jgi:hypothetical protein
VDPRVVNLEGNRDRPHIEIISLSKHIDGSVISDVCPSPLTN